MRAVAELSTKELSAVQERANKGDAGAQVTLGIAHDGGSRLFKRDPNEARRWYEKAAQQGNLDAQFWLVGLEHPDRRGARSSYLRLAKSGHIGGMNAYASLCADGTDGLQNFAEAMLWWKRASGEGSAEAAFNVGIMYFDGEGVTANEQEAVP